MENPIPSSERYDFVILGSGEAGKYLAWTLGKKGKRVVVVEREYIGGSCPNIACLPSKNVIHSAKVAWYFSRSDEFGLSKDHVKLDMAQVRARKRKMVEGLVDVHVKNYKASNAELLMGTGRFIAPKTLEVTLNDGGKRTLYGDKIIISTGSRATIAPTPGLREANPLTHIGVLELDQVPEHLLVLGGGFIGLELAQALRR